MKKITAWTLVLALIFLCACTPATLPSDLTAPPSGAPTPTLPPKENPLEGIGTLCDIAGYGEEYLLLTHTGLYILDKDFINRRSAGEVYNAIFAKEDGGLLDRLRNDPDYKTCVCKQLNVLSDGRISFAINQVGTLLEGEHWSMEYDPAEDPNFDPETLPEGKKNYPRVQYLDPEDVAEYRGSVYTISGNKIFKDGEFLCSVGPSVSDNPWFDTTWRCQFIRLDGRPHVYCIANKTEEKVVSKAVYPITDDGQLGESIGEGWGELIAYACDDKYCYSIATETREPNVEFPTMELITETFFKRTSDGIHFEYLDCPTVLGSKTLILRMIVTDESHVLLLLKENRIETAEFSVKEK